MRVRTTLRPHEEIDVDGAEYLDLQRQGLLVEQAVAPASEPASGSSEQDPPSSDATDNTTPGASGSNKKRS